MLPAGVYLCVSLLWITPISEGSYSRFTKLMEIINYAHVAKVQIAVESGFLTLSSGTDDFISIVLAFSSIVWYW